MHKKVVINFIARALLIVCFFMLAPLTLAFFEHRHHHEVLVFLLTIGGGSAVAGFLLWRFPVLPADYEKLNPRDGLAIVGLTWLGIAVFSAIPLYFGGAVPTPTDAFFEAISGLTTTGSSVIPDVESLSVGVLFWRSMTTWLGGIGIIVLYLVLLPALGQNAYQIFKAEVAGITVERIQPRIRETAKILLLVYFLLTFAEVVFLSLAGMPVFDAICHSFATIATAGFSTKNASIGAYSPLIQWIVLGFMFLGGTNFVLHYFFLTGKKAPYARNEEFRFYFYGTLLLTAVFSLVLKAYGLSSNPVRDAAFSILTIITTTGFSTANFDLWPEALRFLLLMMMFVGGCSGSTAGGLKIVRLMLSVKIMARGVMQAIFPNAVIPVKSDGRALTSRVEAEVTCFVLSVAGLVFAGAFLLTVTENCDLVTALSAAFTNFSNVGPGLAKVGPTMNYAWVSVPGKWLLAFLMLAGRLELYAVLFLVLPLSWRK